MPNIPPEFDPIALEIMLLFMTLQLIMLVFLEDATIAPTVERVEFESVMLIMELIT